MFGTHPSVCMFVLRLILFPAINVSFEFYDDNVRFFLKGLFIGVFVVLCVRANQSVAQDVVVTFIVQYRIIRQRGDRVHCIIQVSHADRIEQVCDVQFVYRNALPIRALIHFMNQDYRMRFRTLI